MESRTDLEESVMRTALWFSQFSYPLTVFEIWKWLLQPKRSYGLAEVYAVLERSEWLREKLESQEGFYTLKGSGIKRLIQGRQEKFLDAERKFALLRRMAKYFLLLPGVRFVAAANTLAWWSTTKQSDIDLYVVTRSGHMWSSRFWLVLPFFLMGRRPMQGRRSTVKDPFCFSFFSTDQCLNMEGLCLPRDFYMAFWIRSLVPIFDRGEHFEALQRENRWVARTIPNAQARALHPLHRPCRFLGIPIQWRFTEPLFRSLQRNRFPARLRDIANLDTRVIVTDEMLKFHDNDRRAQYRDAYELLLTHHL